MKQKIQWLKRVKQLMLLCFSFLFHIKILAQNSTYNLVPNPSFEQYTNCPDVSSFSALKASKPDIWYKPDAKFGAYYHTCAVGTNAGVPYHVLTSGPSFQYPRTGLGYVSMFYYNGGDARNYFQVQLADSLRAGRCYYAEYYVSLANSVKLACNNQGILFTINPIYADIAGGHEIIPANPQIINYSNPVISDTLNWVRVSGVFMAQGGEKYLTIGNFKTNSQTIFQLVNPSGGYNGAIYYADDVSVIPLDSMPLKADAGEDRTIPIIAARI